MIATIGVEGLEIRCIVGVLPHEREAEQTLFVDVEIDRSIAAAVASEDVADTVDYVAIADDVTTLAVEEPRQLPFYFVLARCWVLHLGSSMAVLRALSAVLGVLSLPLVFLLCRELYDRSLEGWAGNHRYRSAGET